MFGPRWKLFRLFGIPVRMDASWLFTLLLITWVLASKVFRVALPHLPQLDWWLLGLLTAVAYFTCILLHEMGHALVARSRGIPIRGITLFFLGGVAEMRTEPQSARNEFLLAVAGPAVSLVLAAAFWLLAGYAEAAEWSRSLVVIFGYLAFINLTILLFNLVPAFPLDGGRVLRSMLWGVTGDVRRATYWASLLGQGFSWVLAGAAAFLAVTGDFMGGLFLGLIALFLNDAARSSYRQVLIRQGFDVNTADNGARLAGDGWRRSFSGRLGFRKAVPFALTYDMRPNCFAVNSASRRVIGTELRTAA